MKKIIVAFAATIITLFVAELALRSLGQMPGVYQVSKEFKKTDSLILYKNFTVDELGIYKFSPWIIDSFPKYFDCKSGQLTNTAVRNSLAEIDKIDFVYTDFACITQPGCCNTFTEKIKNLFKSNASETKLNHVYNELVNKPVKDSWEIALVNYVHRPFNAEGFRSIEFKNHVTPRKKILVIGDSFVYGLMASPFHASFTDILLANGYMVYAAGIPGTDPAQYAAIAHKYIPVIQPDLVVMCFYEGNDYMPFNRESHAEKPIEYLTNAGFYQSSPYGSFMSLHDCYNYYESLITIPVASSEIFNVAMSKTCITSLIWGVLYKLKIVSHQAAEEAETKMNQMLATALPEYTVRHIASFNAACLQHRTPVLYTIIPDRFGSHNINAKTASVNIERAKSVFKTLPFIFHEGMSISECYLGTDVHFSNKGALHFADFLDSCIQAHSSKPGLINTNNIIPEISK